MVIYDTPLISRVSSIWSAVPPTIIILNPACALLLSPGFHKLFWILVQFLDTTSGAAPIRKLKMWLVHRRLPVSSPFKTDRYASPPAWGCGLKMIRMDCQADSSESPPAWWCGLKYLVAPLWSGISVSPPAWWCGLKLLTISCNGSTA